MKKWITLHKFIGETPLQVIEKYREQAHVDSQTSLAYAGRLDPMADGKLLVLIGGECKHQEKYHQLDKAYRFEILFGFKSDTGDVLGLAQASPHKTVPSVEIKKVLKKFIGTNEFPYPKFSSKTVRGKPLHTWTLEGRLNEIEIPKKVSMVYTLKLISLKSISRETLEKNLVEKIDSIPPVTDARKALGRDFRRKEIHAEWKQLLNQSGETEFLVGTFYCEASSGTYVRTLAEEIGKQLNTYGLAYSITRTRIGKLISTPLGAFWYKQF